PGTYIFFLTTPTPPSPTPFPYPTLFRSDADCGDHPPGGPAPGRAGHHAPTPLPCALGPFHGNHREDGADHPRGSARRLGHGPSADRKSTGLNSSHVKISDAVFCLKKKSK